MATLEETLRTLETGGLIRVAQLLPELEYLFCHELIRDAIYGALLKQDRRELHRVVGEAIERLYPTRLEELAPVLGQHFDLADDATRAVKYLMLAGDSAARRFATAEAILHYDRALELASKAKLAESLPHLYKGRGHVLEHSGRFEDAAANYEQMLVYARQQGDRNTELDALMSKATVHAAPAVTFDAQKAQSLSDQALALAAELNNRQAEATILWNLMLLNSSKGDPKMAISYGERSLTIARELNLREQLAYTLNDLASHAYLDVGMFDAARKVLLEARPIWEELDNQAMLADNYSTSAMFLLLLGQFDEVIEASEQARRISEATDNLWGQSYSRFVVGEVYVERGLLDTAMRIMQECAEMGDQSGFVIAAFVASSSLALVYGKLGRVKQGRELAEKAVAKAKASYISWQVWPIALLARLCILAGDLKAAEELVDEIRGDADKVGMSARIYLKFADAELALARSEPARALNLCEKLITLLQETQIAPFIGEALLFKGKVLVAQGKLDEAQVALTEARAAVEKLGSRWTLWTILAALAEIEAKRDNKDEADKLRQQAGEHIRFIADHISDKTLRKSFLGLGEVKSVLAAV